MITFRPMTQADVALGMRLITQAGWNQTLDDWQRFIQLSRGTSFVALDDGREAGTVVGFVFEEIAWIAMVLVDEQMRGGGIGKALMHHILQVLRGFQVRSIRLDATHLGRPIYEKLGFVREYDLMRWQGTLAASAASPSGEVQVLAMAPAHRDAVVRLDRKVAGTRRAPLFDALLGQAPTRALVALRHGVMEGFAFIRPGTHARQIGPVIATTQTAGLALLDHAAATAPCGLTFIDIDCEHTAANAWARQQGMTEQRRLVRMVHGAAIPEARDHRWASSGPEKG